MKWKIKKRHSLRKRDIRKIKNYIKENFTEDLVPDGEYETCKLTGGDEVILVDRSPQFWIQDATIIPSLKMFTEKSIKDFTNYVIVDMGAVPHIANGADVMAPGIVEIGEFESDEFVFVGDEEHGKILSIGVALMGSGKISGKEEGKVVKTVHYAGDEFWEFDV